MGIMVYSLLWVMQDFVHQQYVPENPIHLNFRIYLNFLQAFTFWFKVCFLIKGYWDFLGGPAPLQFSYSPSNQTLGPKNPKYRAEPWSLYLVQYAVCMYTYIHFLKGICVTINVYTHICCDRVLFSRLGDVFRGGDLHTIAAFKAWGACYILSHATRTLL